MTHAIRFHKPGGPDVLVWEEVNVGRPGPGQARIRHTAVGLNFVDIYNRSGLYPLQLPSGLGGEAAGVVEEVGAGVASLKPGDRVAYGAAPIGAYAEARLIPADRLLKLPDSGAMGKASRRHRHRHRRQRRESKTGESAWLRPHHRLHARGFCEARRRD